MIRSINEHDNDASKGRLGSIACLRLGAKRVQLLVPWNSPSAKPPLNVSPSFLLPLGPHQSKHLTPLSRSTQTVSSIVFRKLFFLQQSVHFFLFRFFLATVHLTICLADRICSAFPSPTVQKDKKSRSTAITKWHHSLSISFESMSVPPAPLFLSLTFLNKTVIEASSEMKWVDQSVAGLCSCFPPWLTYSFPMIINYFPAVVEYQASNSSKLCDSEPLLQNTANITVF